jgi:hypothetical protein
MEIPEMIGWMASGFVPTYIVLEVGTRELVKRLSARLYLNTLNESKGKKELRITGLQ